MDFGFVKVVIKKEANKMSKKIETLCEDFHNIIEQYGEMMLGETEAIEELELAVKKAKTIDTQSLNRQTTL